MRFEEAPGIKGAFRMDLRHCEPSVTKEEAIDLSTKVLASPGKVVVACHRKVDRYGSVLITEEMQEDYRPDVATVIAVGEPDGDSPDFHHCGLKPGDTVLTDHELGKRVAGIGTDFIELDAEVRMYGVCGGTAMDSEGSGDADVPVQDQDWSDGVPCVLDDWVPGAVGDKVVFKLPPLVESSHGILLSDSVKHRSSLWEVTSVGDRTKHTKVGMKCCVHTGAATKIVTDNGVEYAVAPESKIYFRVL